MVTDVASVKGRPLASLLASGTDGLDRYVGGHPLAGRERSGAVAARGDLFVGRPWVLTPSQDARPDAVAVVRDLAVDLGAAPVVMPAADHDGAVARVSHVPQVAASLVAARLLDAEDGAVALAGQGLRDVTRVAASDPELWVQILGANAGPVAEVLRALRGDLDSVVAALEALAVDADAPGARADLARALDAGVRGQARIPGKHGAAPQRFAVVTVQVPDRPGELARMLAAMGEARGQPGGPAPRARPGPAGRPRRGLGGAGLARAARAGAARRRLGARRLRPGRAGRTQTDAGQTCDRTSRPTAVSPATTATSPASPAR